ncbi:hypothetical protein tb265_36650 [Gemmatimonadetes bacterium T265]|nr:hypothetical protein tb265_36650 [Gemmatimonadetes bacterium T265]
MITPESIERVREAADIVEIVGEHVKLKRSGSSFRGPCPFHHGTGPNFSVIPRTNAYYCFVCHAKGDVIGFVRDHLGMDFVDAVKYVADRAGVEVQETRNPRAAEERDAREPLWEATAAAAELFRATLWEDAEAQSARDYLASRGVGREEADRFGLGYAWRDGARWAERLRALGHDDARLVDVGLLRRRDDRGDETFPYFRGRLMIPIQDAGGRTVGFGGRVIGQGEPKYLNSPQGMLFDKGRQLYGLSWAKHPIRKAERALVVEGYFDAIRLALAGVEEAVAPLGTAMTEAQAALVAKLTRNVFLVYDSDAAGLKATVRAGHELLRLGVAPRVVSLPGGEDPDTFVRTHGRDAMEAALAQGLDLLDWQLLLLQRRAYFADLHRTRQAIDKLLPTVRAASDPVTRDLYIAKLAEVTRLDRDVLQREVDAPPQRASGAAPAPGARPSPTNGGAPAAPVDPTRGPPRAVCEVSADGVEYVTAPPAREDRPGFRPFVPRSQRGRRAEEWVSVKAVPRVPLDANVRRAERYLIRAMVQDRALVETVAERWQPEAFFEDAFRELFGRLLADPYKPLDDATEGFPEHAMRAIDEAVSEHDPTPDLTVASWLQKLQVWALDAEKTQILRRFAATDAPLRDDEKDALTERMRALQAERAALSPTFARVAGFLRNVADERPAGNGPGPA